MRQAIEALALALAGRPDGAGRPGRSLGPVDRGLGGERGVGGRPAPVHVPERAEPIGDRPEFRGHAAGAVALDGSRPSPGIDLGRGDIQHQDGIGAALAIVGQGRRLPVTPA